MRTRQSMASDGLRAIFEFTGIKSIPNLEMKRILIILFFICINSFGQTIRIDTLKIPIGQTYVQTQESHLKFPVIKTTDPKVDSLINTDLKNRFTNNEYPHLATDSTLIKWAGDQIVYLDFEITYIKNGLISLNIFAEGCAAYCTSWTDYFTYSTTTGKYVTINEIIDTAGKFKNIVITDKNRQYDEQRKELKNMLLDKKSGLNEEIYESALEYYDNCDKSFTLKSFALHLDHLEIIENCNLSHAIRNLDPKIELNYKYNDIKEYLKIKN